MDDLITIIRTAPTYSSESVIKAGGILGAMVKMNVVDGKAVSDALLNVMATHNSLVGSAYDNAKVVLAALAEQDSVCGTAYDLKFPNKRADAKKETQLESRLQAIICWSLVIVSLALLWWRPFGWLAWWLKLLFSILAVIASLFVGIDVTIRIVPLLVRQERRRRARRSNGNQAPNNEIQPTK